MLQSDFAVNLCYLEQSTEIGTSDGNMPDFSRIKKS
jgi:hypothetical protein